jgi:hypothetical protein
MNSKNKLMENKVWHLLKQVKEKTTEPSLNERSTDRGLLAK